MTSSFKSHFNAAHAKATEQEKANQEAFERLKKDYSEKYPATYRAFLQDVQDVFDGVNGVQIIDRQINVEMTYYNGQGNDSFGTIGLPERTITFHGKKVTFCPVIASYVGCKGKILVDCSTSHSINEYGLIMAESSDGDGAWVVAERLETNKLRKLDKDALEKLLMKLLT